MTTHLFARLRNSSLILLIFCSSIGLLPAEQFGNFTYRVITGGIEITDYPTTEVGAVVIPAEIDGLPVTSIGDSAFSGCDGLTSVTFASLSSVASIGDEAFGYCSRLTSITLPASVTSIGIYAFAGCRGLTGVTFAPLSSVASIGDYAFFGCSGLTSVTIPASVASIGNSAFSGCSGLTSMTFAAPSSVASIGAWAFFGCSGLTSVMIPDSVTNIGFRAFYGCSGLTSLIIPSTVTDIGQAAFELCSGLTSIAVEVANPSYRSLDGVLFNKSATRLIQYPGGLTGVYAIPASVTSIGDWAFSVCGGLTGVTIPEGVTSIGDSAFAYCRALTSITLPASVTSIGKQAFEDCSGLTSMTIPDSVISIGDTAFGYCSGLTRITLPAIVANIGAGAFYGCSGLTSVTIPASVTSIGSAAFRGCGGLASAVFLGDAPALGSWVFESAAPGFIIRYLSGSSGFTSPTWNTYRTEVIDESTYPAASWLLANGLDHDTDLRQDLNGDGVSLLLAYALNLNPHLNLQASMPAPVLEPGTMSMTFHAASPGITYSVQTSTNLRTWVADGVSLSELAPDNTRIATVDRLAPVRFLRLVVTD